MIPATRQSGRDFLLSHFTGTHSCISKTGISIIGRIVISIIGKRTQSVGVLSDKIPHTVTHIGLSLGDRGHLIENYTCNDCSTSNNTGSRIIYPTSFDSKAQNWTQKQSGGNKRIATDPPTHERNPFKLGNNAGGYSLMHIIDTIPQRQGKGEPRQDAWRVALVSAFFVHRLPISSWYTMGWKRGLRRLRGLAMGKSGWYKLCETPWDTHDPDS